MRSIKLFSILCIILFISVQMIFPDGASAETIYLITDNNPGAPVQHGLKKLRKALKDNGITTKEIKKPGSAKGGTVIIVGLGKGTGEAAVLHKSLKITPPKNKESLLIQHTQWKGKKVLLISGADERGLMYALLDTADRISWTKSKKNPLEKVQNIKESPYVSQRALSKYTMHQEYVESYFYNEKYWARYLDMLAENRFNTFVFILGYAPATYFAPSYPFFFNVKGFPDIRVEGLTEEGQQRNLKALNMIIKMTHERGMNFTLGIWDHISTKESRWRKGMKKYKESEKKGYRFPSGVTKKNLIPYTKASIAKLLRLVPDLDAIQFRMHWESGLPRDEKVLVDFWGSVFKMIRDARRDIRIDLRAKGLPDSVIERARQIGVDFRITTKYWAEQMGQPFHPAHINKKNQRDRRHGYADLLQYPPKFKIHWKLWNAGSNKVLIWGDPDYVRRFAQSTHLYDGDGFEVNEIGATKMALHPDEKPYDLLRRFKKYYDWEFERYWHFFRAFGRIGYNPKTSMETWQMEFENRFGKEAGLYIEKGLRLASRVVPRIIGYAMNHFPTLRGFPEMDRCGSLEKYIKIKPSDIQTFLGINDAAKYIINGKETAKIKPQETSIWFADISRDILEQVLKAEKHIGKTRNKEFKSTMIDLKVLAYLALFHSHRIHSGINWALFKRIKDLHILNAVIVHEKKAADAYEKIMESTVGVYNSNLIMGHIKGNWLDEFVKLKGDLMKLYEKRERFRPKTSRSGKPLIAHIPVRFIKQNEDLMIKATVSARDDITSVRAGYKKGAKDYKYMEMEKTGPYTFQAKIPADEIKDKIQYFIKAEDKSGLSSVYPKNGRSNPINVIIKDDFKPPILLHKPVISALPLKPLKITAEVNDPSGIKWVRVLYRNVTQFQDYKILDMHPAHRKGQYEATIPGKDIISKWDFMYLFEVMDNKGNGKIYPDMEKETPYIVVKLKRDK